MGENQINNPEITSERIASARIENGTSGKTTRLKLWEIEPFFKCPVVGLCLTSSEQQRILKKAGITLNRGSLFEIHEILVTSVEKENPLSQKVDRLLSQKFWSQAESLRQLEEREFMNHWRASFKAGHYTGAFWTAATMPNLSPVAKLEIYGALHMSMFAAVEIQARDRQRLEHLKGVIKQQAQRIITMNMGRRDLQKKNKDMGLMLTALKAELHAAVRTSEILRNEVEALKTQGRTSKIEAENQALREELIGKRMQINVVEQMVNHLKKRSAELEADLENQRRENSRFKEEAQEVLHEFLHMNRCNNTCPAFDLCRKRILIVGGIARMEALYRRLIEDNGGVFEYHDGYMHAGAKQLESRLKWADIVLCPVNSNSHAACSLVKNLGKKHNKPVHMLANFSLSAVSQALTTNDKGTFQS